MNHATPPERGHYALLRADRLGLLIPKDEMGATEHLSQQPVASDIPGLLTLPGHDHTCFLVLSERLQLLDHCPGNRYVTTKMVTEDGTETHWCWTEVRMLIDFVPRIHPVPEVLLQASSPLRHYAIMDGQPVFLCSAQILQEVILSRI